MKVLSVGRNPDCNIVFDDPMISRRHAVIKVYSNGKYEIVCNGVNGTKVNGNQIAQGQPYPVKRGDSVTFGHVANLDWKKVPNPMKPIKIGLIILGALIVVTLALIFIVPRIGTSTTYEDAGTSVGDSSHGLELQAPETNDDVESEMDYDTWANGLKKQINANNKRKQAKDKAKQKEAQEEAAENNHQEEAQADKNSPKEPKDEVKDNSANKKTQPDDEPDNLYRY